MTDRPGNQFPEIPGYRLESILGRGSMATVYRARQKGMERPVAVKVLREEVIENPKLLKRLMREARIAARFNHPHIVRALDAGLHEGSCYFVMELVEGFSIREVVEREGPYEEERVIEIAIELAEALNELHHSHVVHRDVKPANVIIDQEGRALLADLGLAKIEFDSSMTSQHRTVGTPAYMSPEQVKDPDRVDSRSDLFSLGVTIFYMFTGTSPFAGTSVSSVLTKILYDESPSLRSVAPEVSFEMDTIVARLLEKERSRRYSNPSALLRDLRALSRGAELPLGRLAPTKPKRNQQLMIAAVAASVLVTLGVFLWPRKEQTAPVRETRSRERATEEAVKPAFNEAELERDLVRVLRAIELDLKTSLDGGDLDAVRSALEGRWLEQFEAGMGGKMETLPRIAQLRWENAKLEYDRLIVAKANALNRSEFQKLQSLYETEIEHMAESEVFLSASRIAERLNAIPQPSATNIEEASLKLARQNAVDGLLTRWRLEVDRELEKARASLAAGDLDDCRATLKALEAREPAVVAESSPKAIAAIRNQMQQGLAESSRRIENALAIIDILPPLGFPELADREFAPVIERIEPVVRGLSSTDNEGDATTLVTMFEVLQDVAELPSRLVIALRNERIPKTTVMGLRSGETFKVAQVLEIHDDRIKYQGSAELPVEVFLKEINEQTLIELVGVTDPIKRERSSIFLKYCDGNLLEAELQLAKQPVGDGFRDLMTKRLTTAWVDVAHVRSPSDKEAFRVWTETLAAFRGGEIEAASKIAKPLRINGEIKKSDWYREKRLEIHRVLEEIDLRLAVAGSFGPKSKSWQLLTKSPAIVRAAWNFESEAEALDFVLPKGHAWIENGIGRITPASALDLRPDRLDAIRLDFDADLEAGVFELRFDLRCSSRIDEAPRLLVLSIGGHHIGLLSRLRQTSSFRHLQLHGAERLVSDFMQLGRLAQWDGPLDAYRQAFVTSLYPKPLVLDVGRLYHFHIRMDPKDKILHLRLDDVEVLARKLPTLNLSDKGIEWRAAMPFTLHSITLESALRLN